MRLTLAHGHMHMHMRMHMHHAQLCTYAAGEPVLIWSPGRVERVADGLTDTRSARAKKILPAGALLWSWEADKDFDEQAGESVAHLATN